MRYQGQKKAKISRRRFMQFTGALAAGSIMSPAISRSANKKRNLLFILIDDQRFDFLSAYGHPWIKTPNIDKLVQNSMIMKNAFVTTSLCSPSRASILTGMYAHTHQVMDNDTPLPASLPTFPRILRDNGYTTGFIGKWHMGGNNDNPRPGFDFWLSFHGQGSYEDPTLNMNGERINRVGYTPDILTEYTQSFIRDNAHKDKPFCLYLSHKSVHESFVPAPRHRGKYKDLVVPRPENFADTDENYEGKPRWVRRQRKSWHGAERDFNILNYGSFDHFFQLYSECMLAVDDSIGRITETLKKEGLLDDTLIIYMADNGYLMGEHGLIDKRVMYEESMRVPCFVHCPELVPKQVTREELVLNIDIGPTLLDAAGIRVPDSMHGKSFYPLIAGRSVKWRDAFVYEYFCDHNAVQTPTIFGLRTEKFSYITSYGIWDQWELYDLENDPHQDHNLLGHIQYGQNYGPYLKFVQQQDPELYPLVKELDDRLNAILADTGGVREPRWQ